MTAYPKGVPSGVKAHYPAVYNDGSSSGPVGSIHSNFLAVANLGKNVSDEDEADMGPDQDGLNNIKPQTNSALTCSKGIVSEWAVQNQYLINLPAGLNKMTTTAFLSWQPDNASSEIWMRITLSEKPWTGGSAPGSIGNGGSGPKNGYGTGETEDYYFLPGESF